MKIDKTFLMTISISICSFSNDHFCEFWKHTDVCKHFQSIMVIYTAHNNFRLKISYLFYYVLYYYYIKHILLHLISFSFHYNISSFVLKVDFFSNPEPNVKLN